MLGACATQPATSYSTANSCLRADRSFELVKVEDRHHAIVRSRPGPSYRLTFAGTCELPHDTSQATIGFSNGPALVLDGRHGPVWANRINGSALMCGHAGDRLTWREWPDQLDTPARQCRILSVERLK
jgi:hypothetical protein